ncbi:MAG: prepilin-type N-terminal cleavage/methylation domain-containing protein [Azoarcus sp.]|jgi:prepilin-type N-terminal cleavage/methylation domain-containing protein|nr:prepilin-type N-terminal cleavage/methylation domain-containing protein [Azoarcus sp.]
MHSKQIARQSGFTLVEISIVLVIVGLLLGGVLKGQELIDSAKTKNLAQDFRSVPMFINTYQDIFHALPGDDSRARSHVCPASDTACTVNGNANGSIGGNWNDETGAGSEAIYFWQHIRLANLAAGATSIADPDFLPLNSVGGRLGIQTGGATAPLGISGNYIICSAGIPGKIVRQLDGMLDDGNPATGAMRAGVVTDSALAEAATLDDGTAYVACLGV